jgi:hypothetical protein
MTFRKSADGITQKGKTKGKNLGDTGPTVGIQSSKGSKGASTVTNKALKSLGRNVARANNQK